MSPVVPPKLVKDLLESLLGRDVLLASGLPVPNAASAAFAVYVNDATRLSAVVSLDLKLSAYLGTSVVRFPRLRAQEIIDDRYLPEAVFTNVEEIFEAFAATLKERTGEHQRLYATYRGAARAPLDATTLAASLGNRLDLSVTVEKYGTGALSCVLC